MSDVNLTDTERERLLDVLDSVDLEVFWTAGTEEVASVVADLLADRERAVRAAALAPVLRSCPQCHGSGLVQGAHVGEPVDCPTCNWVRPLAPDPLGAADAEPHEPDIMTEADMGIVVLTDEDVPRTEADVKRAVAAALAPIQALADEWERDANTIVRRGMWRRGWFAALATLADEVHDALAAAGVDAAPNETAEIAERSDPAWTFDLMVKDGSITREAADLALGRMRQQDEGVVVPDAVWRARHSPSALAAALDEVRAQALRDAAADLDDDRHDVKRLLLARAAVPSGHEQEGDGRADPS